MNSVSRIVFMTILIGIIVPMRVVALDQTATGFYYPTGTSNIGSYGWLLEWPSYPFYNKYHIGADIDADSPDPVYAIADGTVIAISSGPTSGWGDGNVGIFIRHQLEDESWIVALYGHVRTSLEPSDQVEAGDQIATIGPLEDEHLHFGIHPGYSMPSDPYGMLPLPVTYPYNGWVDPVDLIESETPAGIFSCSYVSQSSLPSSVVPGQELSLWVKFKNEGTATWSKDPNSPNFVELASCGSSGESGLSYLNFDPRDSENPTCLADNIIDWRNCIVPPWFTEQNVPPGYTATFNFPGRVKDNATGSQDVYFAPFWNSAVMPGWNDDPFVPFTVSVSNLSSSNEFEAFWGDFNGDGYDDVGLWERTAGNWYVALRDSDEKRFIFNNGTWLDGWGTLSSYNLVVGDFDGDGKDDICLHKTTDGSWYVALSTGSDFDTDGTWKTTFGASSEYQALVGDFDNNGKDDICIYRPGTDYGTWHVAKSTGSAFGDGSEWLSGWGTLSGYQPLVADYSGNGKDDICLYRPANGNWYVATSDGSSFTTQGVWKSSWGNQSTDLGIAGKFNLGDDKDVGFYRSDGSWYVAYSSGTAFGTGSQWLSGWGTLSGYQVLTGDFNGDYRTDVCLYRPANGNWYVSYSTGSAFTKQGTWLFNWGIETGGSPKLQTEPESETLIPIQFSLNQNYPNPFNPVTTIEYSLPEATHVRIDVYNILGQKVETLADEYQAVGDHTATWDASHHASGVYFYRIQAGDAVQTKKMVLLK